MDIFLRLPPFHTTELYEEVVASLHQMGVDLEDRFEANENYAIEGRSSERYVSSIFI